MSKMEKAKILSLLFAAAHPQVICYDPVTKTTVAPGVTFTDLSVTLVPGTHFTYGFDIAIQTGYYCFGDFSFNFKVMFEPKSDGDLENFLVTYLPHEIISSVCIPPSTWDSVGAILVESGDSFVTSTDPRGNEGEVCGYRVLFEYLSAGMEEQGNF